MSFIGPIFSLFQNLAFAILGIFGIGFLIGFHELGHFFFCKLFKIRTPSFSIGFGPKIASKKIGDTEFVIAPIPLGGYVEIAGSAEIGQGEQKDAYSKDPHSFATKPFYQKLFVMFGGILFNLLFAYCAFILVFFTGIPKSPLMYPLNTKPIVQVVEDNSVAQQAGIQPGDTITQITVDNKKHIIIDNVPKLVDLIKQNPNQKALIEIKRDEQKKNISLIIGSKDIMGEKIGSIGIILEVTDIAGYPFFKAIKFGFHQTNTWIYRTFQGFASIFRKKDISGMAGPLMIVSMTIKGASAGFKIFLLLLAIISINLAVLNLIPLPILDGGQILFYTIEAIIRRPLPEKIKYYIHLVSWLAILGLILYLSLYDIARIASPFIESGKKFLGLVR